MQTEDDVAKAVDQGTMTLDEVVAAFQGNDMVVYPDAKLVEGEETWQQVEERASGSTMFASLQKAGATPEQIDEIGTQIVRLRAIGNTMDKVFGWGPGDINTEGSAPAEEAPPTTPEAPPSE